MMGGEKKSTDQIGRFAFNNGYDGVIIKDVIEFKNPHKTDVYITKNPNQIKSSTDNSGYFDTDDNNIYHQTAKKKKINGYFDSDLKVIVLGENLNNGTLPHEMAHFFLDRTFELWRDNQGTKEFRNYFDRIAESLNISKEQSSLTTEQQEKFARMTEAYLFGLGIPDGQKGIFDFSLLFFC